MTQINDLLNHHTAEAKYIIALGEHDLAITGRTGPELFDAEDALYVAWEEYFQACLEVRVCVELHCHSKINTAYYRCSDHADGARISSTEFPTAMTEICAAIDFMDNDDE